MQLVVDAQQLATPILEELLSSLIYTKPDWSSPACHAVLHST